jgi:hypothetical protein
LQTAVSGAAGQSAPDEPAIAALYGVVAGRRSFDEKDAPDYFVRDAEYPRGVFAVSWEAGRWCSLERSARDCTETSAGPWSIIV